LILEEKCDKNFKGYIKVRDELTAADKSKALMRFLEFSRVSTSNQIREKLEKEVKNIYERAKEEIDQ